MADKIFFKTGLASSLPTTKTAGQLLFAIDGTTGSIYLDKDSNTRIKFNADAVKLATPRSINGTSFDGSADITTANWGTARNISISDATGANTGTAVSVNGSKAVTLKLPATIVAALKGNADTATRATTADSATTATSCTGNAATATKLKTGVAINGTTFDGSAAITTANWGTARTITISDNAGDYTQANTGINGSANFTLKLPATITATLIGNASSATYATNAGTADTAKACTGNAATASKLKTGVAINGTTFDGSAAITTTKWGTARNVSIGNSDGTGAGTAVSVDGSGAVTLKLPTEIKANVTSAGKLSGDSSNVGDVNTPVYFENGIPKPITSIDVKSDRAAKLDPGASINGTLFTGESNITTSSWGTARTVTISDNSGTNTQANTGINGSANFTLKLPATIKADLTGKATSAGTADTATTATTATTCTGNAGTATKLKTAVAINGTNFDGSTAITTANWGTARNVTIVSSDGTGAGGAVSVNGSGDFALKLPATIKANLTGKATSAGTADTATTATTATTTTGNAGTATKLKTPVAINGTNFDGSTAITTANWGTARNFTIKDADSTNSGTAVSVNGSGAVTLLLPSTIKANITGKATSAGTADSATTATTATTCTGNAATATKLATARSITLVGDVTGSTTFDGTGNVSITAAVVDNSHIHYYNTIAKGSNWNYSGGVAPINVAKYDVTRGCRTAFMPAAAITIEYTQNGGSTWASYEATDEQKMGLFAMNRGWNASLGKSGTTTTNFGLRITVAPTDGRYAQVDNFYCWFTTNGHEANVKIERSTIGNKTTFTTVRENVPVSGWAGGNDIAFSVGSFGGGSTQTSNHYAYRFTFMVTKVGTHTTNPPLVTDLRMYGDYYWSETNSMMGKDHMYSWDVNKNVTFPAQVTATKFNGVASKATVLETARTINGTSFNGSENITTANWGTSRNITIKDGSGNKGTAVAVNGSANVELILPTTIAATVSAANKLTVNAGDINTPVYFEGGVPKPITSIDVKSDKAAKLDPGAKINGTTFTGASDITTSSWGTARTLTVGNTGKSVNGSGNVSWTIAEIGALALTGGTISGKTYINTSSGTNPFYITRIGGTSESTAFWQDDGQLHLDVTNDEATAGISFKLSATDTENSDGSNASSGTITFAMASGATTITANNFAGKATSATKLATARTINGTNFDGSGNITTSYWGTERTISISSAAGTTGTKINGSADKSLVIPKTLTGFTSITSTTFVGNLSGKATSAGTADSATTAASCTGNAATATKLATARTIALAGDVTGSAGFDGSSNISITTAVANDSHNHTYSTISLAGSYKSNTDYTTLPNGVTYVEMPATATTTGDPTYGAMLTVKYGGGRAFQVAGNSSNKLYFRGMHSGLSSDAGTGYGPWRTVALSDGGTYTMNITGNASGTAGKLATARNITISGTASSSVGTFDGGSNTTIYMPLTIQGFNEIKTKKLTITSTEGVSHIVFSRLNGLNYLHVPTTTTEGAIALCANENLAIANSSLIANRDSVYPGTTNVVNLGTSSYKWKGVYATTFHGALSGNATTATTLATSRAFRISDTANSTSTASFNGSADATLYIPTTIKGFTSIESDKYVVNDKVTLQYNTTNECLEFVFA